ncbi:unnamed protein product [marine sediment metagenome]|uniref:Uncharacterized protein n=1 Tax=marine sediment metagenome TaxID=412755 RepID=X0ZQK0_9ZZZZ
MMFHEDAPASEITKPLPLIRPKAEKPLNTIILAKRWVGLYTHWWGGKTVRCPDTGCRACDRNIARIWKGFIPVCDAFMMSSVALLQFTGRCTVTLNENKRDPGGLLGSRWNDMTDFAGLKDFLGTTQVITPDWTIQPFLNWTLVPAAPPIPAVYTQTPITDVQASGRIFKLGSRKSSLCGSV